MLPGDWIDLEQTVLGGAEGGGTMEHGDTYLCIWVPAVPCVQSWVGCRSLELLENFSGHNTERGKSSHSLPLEPKKGRGSFSHSVSRVVEGLEPRSGNHKPRDCSVVSGAPAQLGSSGTRELSSEADGPTGLLTPRAWWMPRCLPCHLGLAELRLLLGMRGLPA